MREDLHGRVTCTHTLGSTAGDGLFQGPVEQRTWETPLETPGQGEQAGQEVQGQCGEVLDNSRWDQCCSYLAQWGKWWHCGWNALLVSLDV